MKLADVLRSVRGLAPERLAEAWDKVGLQVGDPRWEVRRALLCIDLTREVMAEAVAARVGLIIAYHPPIFEPLTGLTTGDAKQRVILEAVQRRIAIYSPHTALDAAEGGVNDFLAGLLGAGEVRAIRPSLPSAGYKLVTFVPRGLADRMRTALSRAGAGVIGNYTECSFESQGEGTFRGGAGAHPNIGQAGRFERVPELRIEMVCPPERVAEVIAAMRKTHPYEEPAFDLFPLSQSPTVAGAYGISVGQGRVVTLAKPMGAVEMVRRLKRGLGLKAVEVAWPKGLKRVRKVGVCAGAGGSLLREAGEIDAFVTGEMRHHDVLAAKERGMAIVLAGHTQTERPYLRVYRKRLERAIGTGVEWKVSGVDRAPSGWR